MKTLMSNLPNDQKIVLNPKTNKPLVRGKNGRFVKNDASQTNSSAPVNTSPASNQAINPSVRLPADTNVADDLNQVPQGYTGTASKEILPNAEEIYLEDAQKTQELKEQLAELEKTAEVKEIKGEVELPEAVKAVGVKQVGEETPLSEPDQKPLPLSDDKIYSITKKTPVLRQDTSASLTWLALWCWRGLSLLHIKLKEVHGKIVRQTG